MMPALYVRNKHAKVVLFYEVVNPDGTGFAMRDRLGHIILVSKTGAFLGYARWFGASAWAETEFGRYRIAYKNPHGKWIWKLEPRKEVEPMKASAQKPKVEGEHPITALVTLIGDKPESAAITQVGWSSEDAQALTALFDGHVTPGKITAMAGVLKTSRGAIRNMLQAAHAWRRDGTTPTTKVQGNLRIRSDVADRTRTLIATSQHVAQPVKVKRSHHRKAVPNSE
jgi:hypothetical protein